MRTLHRAAASRSHGFTLIEMLFAMVVGMLVLGATYELLTGQRRLYHVQREAGDATESTRAAVALLSRELRQAAPGNGDIYDMQPNAVTIRVIHGAGIACSHMDDGSERRFGLQEFTGQHSTSSEDSALVYLVNSGSWKAFEVTNTWGLNPAAGLPDCFWGDTSANWPQPQAKVQVDGDSADLAAIQVGSELRLFRATEYALVQSNNRWWLGRRLGSEPDTQIVAGPLKSPADSGLLFTYFDSDGNVTNDPASVARIGLVLRAESFAQVRGGPTGLRTVLDTASTMVFLRNSQ